MLRRSSEQNRPQRRLLDAGALRACAALVAIGAGASGLALGATAATAAHPTRAATPKTQAAGPRHFSRCPASDHRQLRSHARGASSTLVPGHPRRLLLCRYRGLQGKRAGWHRLIAHRRLSKQSTITGLQTRLNALPAPSGTTVCPNDNGARIIAIFGYRHGAADPVTVALTGCPSATNGPVTRSAINAPALLRRLKALTQRS